MTIAIALGIGGVWLAIALFTSWRDQRRLEQHVAQRPLLNRYWTPDHAATTRGTDPTGLENAQNVVDAGGGALNPRCHTAGEALSGGPSLVARRQGIPDVTVRVFATTASAQWKSGPAPAWSYGKAPHGAGADRFAASGCAVEQAASAVGDGAACRLALTHP